MTEEARDIDVVRELPVRVWIGPGDPALSSAVRSIVQTAGEMTVVRGTNSDDGILESVRRLAPDLTIADIDSFDVHRPG